jgi:hypothetical protein
MEKVTEKWFKDHGWKKYEDKTKEGDYDDISGYEKTVRHSVQYSLQTKDINARWDCIVYVTPPGRYNRKKKVERFYMFWARGKNGFQVENRISHRRFNVDQIEQALKVIGFEG